MARRRITTTVTDLDDDGSSRRRRRGRDPLRTVIGLAILLFAFWGLSKSCHQEQPRPVYFPQR